LPSPSLAPNDLQRVQLEVILSINSIEKLKPADWPELVDWSSVAKATLPASAGPQISCDGILVEATLSDAVAAG
jgi:hypothetical protein